MKLVLADDHILVVEALGAYLTQLRPDMEILPAFNFDQALDHVDKSEDIDLVVFDLHMPGMDGLKGMRLMRGKYPDLPVVILSGQADGCLIRETLENGAAGFIPKDLSGKAMLSALGLVLSGSTYIPKAALYTNHQGKNRSPTGESLLDSQLKTLTSREYEVVALLVKGNTNKDIARELGVSDSTAIFHLKNVYRKLNVASRTQAVGMAIRLGMQV